MTFKSYLNPIVFEQRIVGKLYRKDLEEILTIFYVSKKGTKEVLRQKVTEFIENEKQDIDFDKLNKEIKRVYKSNPKIKKSPKKGISLSIDFHLFYYYFHLK